MRRRRSIFRADPNGSPDINTTPLIDVMLDAVLGEDHGLASIKAGSAWAHHAQMDLALAPMAVELPLAHPDAVNS